MVKSSRAHSAAPVPVSLFAIKRHNLVQLGIQHGFRSPRETGGYLLTRARRLQWTHFYPSSREATSQFHSSDSSLGSWRLVDGRYAEELPFLRVFEKTPGDDKHHPGRDGERGERSSLSRAACHEPGCRNTKWTPGRPPRRLPGVGPSSDRVRLYQSAHLIPPPKTRSGGRGSAIALRSGGHRDLRG